MKKKRTKVKYGQTNEKKMRQNTEQQTKIIWKFLPFFFNSIFQIEIVKSSCRSAELIVLTFQSKHTKKISIGNKDQAKKKQLHHNKVHMMHLCVLIHFFYFKCYKMLIETV